MNQRGYLMSPDESAGEFQSRVELLQQRTRNFWRELSLHRQMKLEDITCHKSRQIPSAVFQEAAETTQRLYDFSINWVPGFFQNPAGSWLFGGCTYSFPPDAFSIFIIRESFRRKRKWLFYDRRELLAHELCHVARAPLNSLDFEEYFAYRTSPAAFRRILGGIFLRQRDSLLFLLSALVLLLVQILRTFLMPSIPLWPFACLLPLDLLWLACRLAFLHGTIRRARRALRSCFSGKEDAVLFRCSDKEIRHFSRMKDATPWILRQTSPRWLAIRTQFASQKTP